LQKKLLNLFIVGWLFIFGFLTLGFQACKNSDCANLNNKQEIPASTYKESSDFRFYIPSGWIFDDYGNNAFQISNSSLNLSVSIKYYEKTNTNNLEQIKEILLNYNGCNPKKAKINNLDFYYTSYDYFGLFQTIYIGNNDNRVYEITLTGKNHDTDSSIKTILDSLIFKAL